MRQPLWGKQGNLDYWSALAHGEVLRSEQKAVELLRRVCDEYRFSLYCVTGQLPVMGNVTKRVYLALKEGGLLELEDGEPVAWWCFSVGPYAPDIPDTDNVVVVRSMVEGEELAFFETADRHTAGFHFTKHSTRRMAGVADPFVVRSLVRKLPRPMVKSLTGGSVGREAPSGPFLWPDWGVGTDRLLDDTDLHRHIVCWLDAYPHLVRDPVDEQERVLNRFAPRKRRPGLVEYHHGQMVDYVQLGDDGGFQVGRDDFEDVELADLDPELRGRIHDAVREEFAGLPVPLVQRAPILPEGIGFDMHDGTVLHVDERASQRMLIEHGIRVEQEIQRLMDEGHPADVIDYLIQTMLAQYLGPNPDLGEVPNPNQMGLVDYVGVREYHPDDPDLPRNAVMRPLPNGNVMLL